MKKREWKRRHQEAYSLVQRLGTELAHVLKEKEDLQSVLTIREEEIRRLEEALTETGAFALTMFGKELYEESPHLEKCRIQVARIEYRRLQENRGFIWSGFYRPRGG